MPSVTTNTPFKVAETYGSTIEDSRSGTSSQSGASEIQLVNLKKIENTNPGWLDQIRKSNGNASTYYFTSGFELEFPPVRFKWKAHKVATASSPYTIRDSYSARFYGQPSSFGFENDTETYNRAINKMKKQLANRIGMARAGAPTAELGELRGLTKQLVHFTGDFLQFLVDVKRRRGRKALKFLGNSWLGYSFAVRPLIKDISEVSRSIADYVEREDQTFRFYSSASKRGMYAYSPSSSVTVNPFGATLNRQAVAAYKLSYMFVGGVNLDIRSNSSYTMLDHLGFRFDQIPAIAWELTAFSWMADYFTNIGNVLEDAMYAPPGTTRYLVVDRLYRVRYQHILTARLLSGNPNLMELDSSLPGRVDATYWEFERTPLASMPHVGLYLKSMDTIGDFGITKLLNLISVLSK